jgi:hypothetical protein
MSIDNRIFVPAGSRNQKPCEPLTKQKYKAGDAMPESQHGSKLGRSKRSRSGREHFAVCCRVYIPPRQTHAG